MKRYKIFMFFAIIVFVLSSIIASAEEAPKEVYTYFIRTSLGHSGNGTAESPYAYFEDALNAVAEGGTIYIADNSFINYNEGATGSPFVITKNVTITSAPGSTRAAFETRTPGIVLGADVTFKNVVLEFPNGYRPVICANGYTLTMDNVAYSNRTRIVHLSGGGMTGFSETEPGPHSKIIVKGKQSKFGNIYAGSINGSFDRDVDITIEDVDSRNIGAVYACGAQEGYYNSDNFMDPDNEPDFPAANADKFPENGLVSIELNNTGIQNIYGKTGENGGTFVSVSSDYLYSCFLSDILALTVKHGTFKPYAINNGADIAVNENAVFDISGIGKLEVNNFYGGGTLMMDYSGALTINGECMGETEFRTCGGGQHNSYIVQPEYVYIKTNSGDGKFTFNPYFTQKGMTFDKQEDGWCTSSAPEFEPIVLKDFNFKDDVIFITETEINEKGLLVELVTEFTESSPCFELSYIPFEYEISHNGGYFYTESDIYNEEYYEGNFKNLNMSFVPAEEDSVFISRFSDVYDWFEHISAGVYDIDISAPAEGGIITRSLRLVVYGDNAEIGDIIAAKHKGKTKVTYINKSGHDINNAKMIAAAYNNELMTNIEISDADVNIKQDGLQTFNFGMPDNEYDAVKVFIWGSIEGMLPLRESYKLN